MASNFNEKDKKEQDQLVKAAMAGKKATPGNQSRARELLGADQGYMAGAEGMTGQGRTNKDGQPSMVANAQLSALQRAVNEGNGGEDANPGQSAGAGPAQKKMGMPPKSPTKGGEDYPDEAGRGLAADYANRQAPAASSAVADATVAAPGGDGSWIIPGIGAVAAIGGAYYLLNRQGKPAQQIPPEAVQEFMQSQNAGAAVPEQGGVPSLRNGTEASIMAGLQDSGVIDGEFSEVPREQLGAPPRQLGGPMAAAGAPGSSPDNPIPMGGPGQPPMLEGNPNAGADMVDRARMGSVPMANEAASAPSRFNIPTVGMDPRSPPSLQQMMTKDVLRSVR